MEWEGLKMKKLRLRNVSWRQTKSFLLCFSSSTFPQVSQFPGVSGTPSLGTFLFWCWGVGQLAGSYTNARMQRWESEIYVPAHSTPACCKMWTLLVGRRSLNTVNWLFRIAVSGLVNCLHSGIETANVKYTQNKTCLALCFGTPAQHL